MHPVMMRVTSLAATRLRLESDNYPLCLGKVCEVSPYMDEYDAITDVPVVRGATMWTDQHTNDEYILVFNEALWMGDTLTHH